MMEATIAALPWVSRSGKCLSWQDVGCAVGCARGNAIQWPRIPVSSLLILSSIFAPQLRRSCV
jgi:hypothetical protein